MIIVLFCNYKADTEIYTYGHTLALHDALPITDSYAARTGRPGNVGVIGIAVFRERHVARIWTPPHPKPPPYPYPADAQAQAQARDASRSEEHTSELQSLMRISYAVFCLKKKKQQQDTTHTKNHHTKTK